ncbi:MAG TPA: PEP-utilizing enzyme [Patescibacteria group bacterium]|nr:PEP-utilizing enzyme [Patescibacteria group bacterium]
MSIVKKKQVKHKKLLAKGVCACPGIARGRAVIIYNPATSIKVKKGVILVAEFTTPLLAVALSRCAGLVLASGGLTAHGAVIAREFGIPCVVGASGALKSIKSGILIEVNATGGKIYEIRHQR